MSMSGSILKVVVLLILPTTLLSQEDAQRQATQIFMLIYNQQYSQAGSLLEKEKNRSSDLYFDVLTIDLAWWKYISGKKKDDLAEFLRLSNYYKNIDTQAGNGNVTRLVGLNYLMRFELKQGNYLKAGIIHLKVKTLLKQSVFTGTSPGQENLYKLYQYLFYYFEKKYIPFSTNPEGISKQKALTLLDAYCRNDDLIINSLANYFIGKIYLEVEKNPGKAAVYFSVLTARFPANQIFTELLQECRR